MPPRRMNSPSSQTSRKATTRIGSTFVSSASARRATSSGRCCRASAGSPARSTRKLCSSSGRSRIIRWSERSRAMTVPPNTATSIAAAAAIPRSSRMFRPGRERRRASATRAGATVRRHRRAPLVSVTQRNVGRADRAPAPVQRDYAGSRDLPPFRTLRRARASDSSTSSPRTKPSCSRKRRRPTRLRRRPNVTRRRSSTATTSSSSTPSASGCSTSARRTRPRSRTRRPTSTARPSTARPRSGSAALRRCCDQHLALGDVRRRGRHFGCMLGEPVHRDHVRLVDSRLVLRDGDRDGVRSRRGSGSRRRSRFTPETSPLISSLRAARVSASSGLLS